MNTYKPKEMLRTQILLQLEAAFPSSIPFDIIFQGIVLYGGTSNPEEILRELIYLQEKSFIHVKKSPLHPMSKRYKLTAAGQDFLQEEGLAQ